MLQFALKLHPNIVATPVQEKSVLHIHFLVPHTFPEPKKKALKTSIYASLMRAKAQVLQFLCRNNCRGRDFVDQFLVQELCTSTMTTNREQPENSVWGPL